MTRIVATLCFAVTLLCPIFCLTAEDGDCSDHGRSEVRNCEAMSVGAVVVKSANDTPPHCQLFLAVDQFLSTESPAVPFHHRTPLVAWNRAATKPPPASTRHALLQSFLF